MRPARRHSLVLNLLLPDRSPRLRKPERREESLLLAIARYCLLLALFVLAAPADSHAQSKIKLGTLLPEGTSQVNRLRAMGQQWTTQTHNAITLTVYPGTQGSEKQLVQKMRANSLQAATLSVGGLSEIDPAVGAIQKIPLLYHSLDEMEYVRTKLQPDMEARLAAKGFIVLFWADAGWVHILAKQPYMRPDDFKKGKIYVTADDAQEVKLINDLGFRAVPLEWTDVFIQLKSGGIDTVPMTPYLAEASQFDTVAQYLLKINYVALVGATVITKTAWDALTPEQQAILRKTGADTARDVQAHSRAEADEAITAMKNRSKLTVEDVSPALEDEWRKFCEGVYPKIRNTMIPADVFDKAIAFVAEYRAQNKSVQPTSTAKPGAAKADPKKGSK